MSSISFAKLWASSTEHRLTKPRTPKTNGMVERFNGRIADVLKTHRFTSGEDLEQTLMRYVALYKEPLHTPRQSKDCRINFHTAKSSLNFALF